MREIGREEKKKKKVEGVGDYLESLFLAQSAHEEATSLASSLVSPGLLIFSVASSTIFAVATGIVTAIATATHSRSSRIENLVAIIISLSLSSSFQTLSMIVAPQQDNQY